MHIHPLPAFSDNYLWLIENDEETWVVDPGDGKVVSAALQERHRTLTGILITHHHPDHIGGIKHLLHNDLIVAGPAKSQHPDVNRPMNDGDTITVCGQSFSVMAVPGHTLNHLAYYSDLNNTDTSSEAPVLFSGDTLFAGGCGRIFEGSPSQMHESLTRFAQLPINTRIYCAHEYTLANLQFALTMEPSNQALQNRIVVCQNLRHKNRPTLPSHMADELETNPFLRMNSAELRASVKRKYPDTENNDIAIFAAVRKLKDNF